MEILSVQYPRYCRKSSVWYEEGTTRTSGDTNFSGVHKDSCAARGSGVRPLASPFSNQLKSRAAQDFPRANS